MLNWLVLLVTTFAAVSATTDKIVCYYDSLAVHRPELGRFTIENIDPNLCTHLIYSSVSISSNASIRIVNSGYDVNEAGFRKFNQLKIQNRNLKTLISIEAEGADSVIFSRVVGSSSLRKRFVRNAVKFLQKYGFNGMDIDWEYPCKESDSPKDKRNFSKLLAELRRAFIPHRFLLTAAVSAIESTVERFYEVPKLCKYLDFINVMAYELHDDSDHKTGQSAPLYASSADLTAVQRTYNVDASIRGWIMNGANPSKLVLGIGAFGRTYTLANSRNFKLRAHTVGAGFPGPYTKQRGILGYNEICAKCESANWQVIWDEQQKVPYAHHGNQWVGYDDPRSVQIKVNYAKSMKLGGVMLASIDTDDFRGDCGPAYPLLNTIVRTLESKPGVIVRTHHSDKRFICVVEGYVRDPHDCNKFYYCQQSEESFAISELQCPGGLYFDKKHHACRDPSLVPC